jgi:hypothetical protein
LPCDDLEKRGCRADLQLARTAERKRNMKNDSRIGQIADVLTSKLKHIEQIFRKRYVGSLPPEKWIGVELTSGMERRQDHEEYSSWHSFLCFGKLKGTWQLYVAGGDTDEAPEDMAPHELASCSLETRRLAAEAVTRLGDRLEALRAEYEHGLTDAAQQLGAYAARLERGVNKLGSKVGRSHMNRPTGFAICCAK